MVNPLNDYVRDGNAGSGSRPAAFMSLPTLVGKPLSAPAGTYPPVEFPLTSHQINAIRTAMRLFIDGDVARGTPVASKNYCDACQRPRPAAGFMSYDRYFLCNQCATEYEVGRARGLLARPGQFVRDKHFGDGDLYVLQA